MLQMSLGKRGFEPETEKARDHEFLDEMNLIAP